ncbi:diacylglycerol kinase [Clostridium polyendosporum]|uniref:Diacylglycerol kinase n=1 Tax=Clostridium polyendosporum TaxID=69208 RepID=A0A919VDS7_9CLOT|nr:diacylglycerol kinase family protein [Clostridium polyendosporum]GIM28349.1 diacylglycerol kinase [Clostridium polyendosporum]
MNHLFIINPAAGKGKGIKYAEVVREYFRHKEDPYYIEFTKGPGDAERIAREYVTTNNYRVYSIGGDGTLNEVLNGIVNSSSSLAVIPSGTGNDFFRNIDASSDESLLYRTIKGKEKYIDIGKVNGRYFLSVASAGIDAEVVFNSDRFKKLPLFNGMSTYVAGVFYTLFKYKSFKCKISTDKGDYHKETLLLAVANGKYYGGGMKIAPLAELNDGYLDIYHIDKANPFRIIFLFPKLIKGTHESIKEVTYSKSKKVKINSQESFLLNIDGEIFRTTEAAFDIISDGIKLVFPLKKNEKN